MEMTVTTKGQVTIPKEYRDLLGIEPNSAVDFTMEGDHLVIKKRKDSDKGRRLIERMTGKGDINLSTDEIMALTRGYGE